MTATQTRTITVTLTLDAELPARYTAGDVARAVTRIAQSSEFSIGAVVAAADDILGNLEPAMISPKRVGKRAHDGGAVSIASHVK